MFTRYTLDEIALACPSFDYMNDLRNSGSMRDTALYVALCSLMRIAGADSPEGGAPETDALRALGTVQRMVEP